MVKKFAFSLEKYEINIYLNVFSILHTIINSTHEKFLKMLDRLSAVLGRGKDPLEDGLEVGIRNNVERARVVASSDVKIAKNNLRIMEVEGEILREAIRHLYEAEADGKINGGELKNLVGKYNEQLTQIESVIQHDKSVVALYDLESIQVDLLELFNKHFSDLNKKIGDLKSHLGIYPGPPSSSKEKREIDPYIQRREKRQIEKTEERKTSSAKSEADQKIGQIQSEIEKTLKKLNKIEIDS